jgi:hypothetical protein
MHLILELVIIVNPSKLFAMSEIINYNYRGDIF